MIDLFVYQDLIGYFVWTLTRVSAVIMSVPVLGTKLINKKIKIFLSVVLTMLIIEFYNFNFKVDLASIDSLIIVLNQFIIGITFGIVLHLVFHSFILMGQIVSMPMALGFASMNDPNSGVPVPVVGQFYLLLITLLFFVFNGHLALIKALVTSFDTLPLNYSIVHMDFGKVIEFGSWMYSNALKISLPMITSLLTVNFVFAIMTKAAPQLNIFSIGFPITLILGIVIVWINIPNVWPHFSGAFDSGLNLLELVIIR